MKIFLIKENKETMIDIQKVKISFKDFLEQYEDKEHLSFKLKVVHTYHVTENARKIAEKLNLSREDIKLAELGEK